MFQPVLGTRDTSINKATTELPLQREAKEPTGNRVSGSDQCLKANKTIK